MGLAESLGSSRWKLARDLRSQLLAMSERTDIVRTMQRVISAAGIERAPADQVVDAEAPERGIVGRLIERGLADELSGRQYAVIDALDGRVHRIDLGTDQGEPLPREAIVRISLQAARGSEGRPQSRRARIQLLSPLSVEDLARHDGATWLDEQVSSETPDPVREAGFGKDVKGALAARRQWLLDQGLATDGADGFEVGAGAMAKLRQRDLAGAAARLSRELGLRFAPTEAGSEIHGTLKRRVDLPSGQFALVEDGRQFSLVPWRPILEPQIGQHVEGIVRGATVSWTFARTRSLEI